MVENKLTRPGCDQIIEILPGPFVIIDRDYRIVSSNNAYKQHYGVNGEDLHGRFCYEVSHHSDVPCSRHGEHCPLEQAMATGEATTVMHVHFDGQGREEFVQLQATPIFSANGEVMYIGEYIQPVQNPGGDSDQLVGRSPAFLRMIGLAQRVAGTSSTVLLSGESGVGKEKVAEYIHRYSRRSNGPFIVVDCSTLGENLIESELFGHEKGAFTGASSLKKGMFEAAHGGTLFIDEIGELPLALQTRLLRVLENGHIRRLGSHRYREINVRVIAASNRDLAQMVGEGRFREDLYYRLSAFPVHVPPLRERRDDIVLLAEHFLHSMPDGDMHVPLSGNVIEKLMGYDYPGNVRELRNIIERAVILAFEDTLRPEHIVLRDDEVLKSAIPVSRSHSRSSRGRVDTSQIVEALQQTNGHRRAAADLLGISERTLYRHIGRLRKRETDES